MKINYYPLKYSNKTFIIEIPKAYISKHTSKIEQYYIEEKPHYCEKCMEEHNYTCDECNNPATHFYHEGNEDVGYWVVLALCDKHNNPRLIE